MDIQTIWAILGTVFAAGSVGFCIASAFREGITNVVLCYLCSALSLFCTVMVFHLEPM